MESTTTTRILIAEDHALVREGLKLLLSTVPGVEVVGETGDGRAVETLIAEKKTDLLLLDLALPGLNGIEIASRLRLNKSDVKIIILTGSVARDTVRKALAVGANGYVIKHEDSSELLAAIDKVRSGRQFVSSRIANAFEVNDEDDNAQKISPREVQILRMIAQGQGNQDIAGALHISVLTVRTHRQNLMQKLGLHNTAEITAFAIKCGIYDS